MFEPIDLRNPNYKELIDRISKDAESLKQRDSKKSMLQYVVYQLPIKKLILDIQFRHIKVESTSAFTAYLSYTIAQSKIKAEKEFRYEMYKSANYKDNVWLYFILFVSQCQEQGTSYSDFVRIYEILHSYLS